MQFQDIVFPRIHPSTVLSPSTPQTCCVGMLLKPGISFKNIKMKTL